MDLNLFFPVTSTIKQKDVKSLVIAMVIYAIGSFAISIVSGLLGWIPLVGWLVRLVCGVAILYCLIGIILGIMAYLKN